MSEQPVVGRNIPANPKETPFGLFLWGGKEKFERRTAILEAFGDNPIFSKKIVTTPSLARKDAWTRAAMQSRELIRLKLKHDWPHRHFMEAIRYTDNMLPVQPQFRSRKAASPDMSKTHVNDTVFMSNLERQMSDEQKAIWIPKAERFEIFGSYSQTELGHGSNVRGIETTATFDPDTDEFIINSPTVSSTKYWIGATGIWATHSIVVARLIINGKEYGNHLFLTQLRHLDTQALMPGVEIYELGPKAFQGMLGTDNGALQFHNVRIPRAQMLARNAQVLRDGTYVAPKNIKHSYGSMVTVRALMAEIVGWDLLKAVAVAYHYTTFRRQFSREKVGVETPVFEYASVQYRLLPLLAQVRLWSIFRGWIILLTGYRRPVHWCWWDKTSSGRMTSTPRATSKPTTRLSWKISISRLWVPKFTRQKSLAEGSRLVGSPAVDTGTAPCLGSGVCMPTRSMLSPTKETIMSSPSRFLGRF